MKHKQRQIERERKRDAVCLFLPIEENTLKIHASTDTHMNILDDAHGDVTTHILDDATLTQIAQANVQDMKRRLEATHQKPYTNDEARFLQVYTVHSLHTYYRLVDYYLTHPGQYAEDAAHVTKAGRDAAYASMLQEYQHEEEKQREAIAKP